MLEVVIIAGVFVVHAFEAAGGPSAAGGVPGWAAFAVAMLGPACALAGGVAVWVCARAVDRTGSMRALRAGALVPEVGLWVALAAHTAAVVMNLGPAAHGAAAWLTRGVPVPLLAEALTLGPLLLAVVLSYAAGYPMERRARAAMVLRDLDEGREVVAPRGVLHEVLGLVRNRVLLVLVPIALLSLAGDAADLVRAQAARRLGEGGAEGLGLAWGAAEVLLALAALAVAPVLLRRAWRASTLGAGPLRSRILGVCDAHGVRPRDVVVWFAGSGVANAAVLGLVPGLRYIVMTSTLLERFPAEEVEAVAAHEVGHVRCNHMFWLGLSVLSTVAIVGAAADALVLRAWGGDPPATLMGRGGVLALAGVTLATGLGVLGWVSRRFERQADAFAVRHASGARRRGPAVRVTPEAVAAMTSALGRVAAVNGVSPERWTWRHGSIASRRRALRATVGCASDALPIDATVRRIKGAVLAASAAGAWLLLAGGGVV